MVPDGPGDGPDPLKNAISMAEVCIGLMLVFGLLLLLGVFNM